MSDTFTVKVDSGHSYEMCELNGLQQVRADMCVPAEAANTTVGMYYRVAMAITKVDDTPLAPASSKIELESRLQRISGIDLDVLVREYYSHIGAKIAALPKQSAPEDEPLN